MSFGASSDSSDTESSSVVQALEDTTSTTSEQLVLSDDAIQSYIDDALGASDGLADIFEESNVAGIYDSTVAAEASGDLVAEIVGELAELTGETVTTTDETTETTATEDTEGETDESGFDFGLDF